MISLLRRFILDKIFPDNNVLSNTSTNYSVVLRETKIDTMRYFLIVSTLLFSITVEAQYGENRDPNSKTIEIVVDEIAAYPGGNSAIAIFLENNMRFPQEVVQGKVKGAVEVKFVVHKDGSLSNFEMEEIMNDCEACNQEALRVCQLMENWIPAKKRGANVDSYYILPIKFEW